MFLFVKILTSDICRSNPDALVVFGDNLMGYGKAGQAIIRDEPNAFGIPTKRLPSMQKDAFFNDQEDEYRIVKSKLIFLWSQHCIGKTVILPVSQIGSGLAKLHDCSPKN